MTNDAERTEQPTTGRTDETKRSDGERSGTGRPTTERPASATTAGTDQAAPARTVGTAGTTGTTGTAVRPDKDGGPEAQVRRDADTDHDSDRDSDRGPVPPAPRTVPAPKSTGVGAGAGTEARAGAGAAAGAAGRTEAGTGADQPLFKHDHQEKVILRLQQAVTGFVESPQRAVEEADAAFDQVVTELTDALDERRRALRAGWQGRSTETGTEELRIALKDYRDITERLLHV